MTLDYLNGIGFNTDEWKCFFNYISDIDMLGRSEERWHRYSIIPGFVYLSIIQQNNKCDIVVTGPTSEVWHFNVNNPNCFEDLANKISELCGWAKNIRPGTRPEWNEDGTHFKE